MGQMNHLAPLGLSQKLLVAVRVLLTSCFSPVAHLRAAPLLSAMHLPCVTGNVGGEGDTLQLAG